jgi:undecaprenyl diphosphate synthase
VKHLAIIADGNRRWARQNGLSIKQGYFYGLETIEKICDWAIENNINFLSFFCFSTENWGRPKEEIEDIMSLIREYFPKIAK